MCRRGSAASITTSAAATPLVAHPDPQPAAVARVSPPAEEPHQIAVTPDLGKPPEPKQTEVKVAEPKPVQPTAPSAFSAEPIHPNTGATEFGGFEVTHPDPSQAATRIITRSIGEAQRNWACNRNSRHSCQCRQRQASWNPHPSVVLRAVFRVPACFRIERSLKGAQQGQHCLQMCRSKLFKTRHQSPSRQRRRGLKLNRRPVFRMQTNNGARPIFGS